MAETLLKIENLTVAYCGARGQTVRVVRELGLEVEEGESVGLVGESGCGKTTLAKAIMGLVRPLEGRVVFHGRQVCGMRGEALREFRRNVQMVFQDPFGSLNPRLSIGSALAEVLYVHRLCTGRAEREARVAQLLEDVGLQPQHADRYPHEFSGGQRQRIGIARALAVNPALIIADEPVSALDVSIQVQILNLLRALQARMGLAYLLIAHDLAVVRYMCRRIAVMYLGRIVESGLADDVFATPAHPYTEALLSAVPDVDVGLQSRRCGGTRIVLAGDVPSPDEKIEGCPFHPRCHRAQDICRKTVPPRRELGNGHFGVCHFAGQWIPVSKSIGGANGSSDSANRDPDSESHDNQWVAGKTGSCKRVV